MCLNQEIGLSGCSWCICICCTCHSLVKVEQVAEKRLLLIVQITPVAILVVAETAATIMVVLLPPFIMATLGRYTHHRCYRMRGRSASRALDYIVEITTNQHNH